MEDDDDRSQPPRANDPMPPKPSLGQPGVRPDWLVSAEAGVEAEASRMTIASRPPVIKPGQPRPPSTLDPPKAPAASDAAAVQAAAGTPILFQMPRAGSEAKSDAPADAPANPGPAGWPAMPPVNPVAATPIREAAAPGPANPFAAAFHKEKADANGGARKAVPEANADDVPWVEPAPRSSRKDRSRLAPLAAPTGEAAESATPATRSRPLVENPFFRVLVGALAIAVLAVGGFQFIPKERGADGTRIAEIRKSPKAFDGRLVTVSGRVGETFQIGSSWAYYLHDGDDALLVFTRKGVPESLKRHTVTGTISTGHLEGDPRPSLFERAS